jgi:sulfur carrier protein
VILTVNGEQTESGDSVSVKELLRSLDIEPDHTGIAVAVNACIVPRDQWPSHNLSDRDEVDIVHAVQGG